MTFTLFSTEPLISRMCVFLTRFYPPNILVFSGKTLQLLHGGIFSFMCQVSCFKVFSFFSASVRKVWQPRSEARKSAKELLIIKRKFFDLPLFRQKKTKLPQVSRSLEARIFSVSGVNTRDRKKTKLYSSAKMKNRFCSVLEKKSCLKLRARESIRRKKKKQEKKWES